MTPDEEWRDIVGWEGLYKVSDRGRVYSVPRTVRANVSGGTRIAGGRILAARQSGPLPYRRVGLTDGANKPIVYVHALVAAAFLGPRPDGMEVRHLDGDPLNNDLSNLIYGTSSQNNLDIVRHGNHHWANKTHCPRDHPYDESNTRIYQGRRFCRACQRERYHRNKEAA